MHIAQLDIWPVIVHRLVSRGFGFGVYDSVSVNFFKPFVYLNNPLKPVEITMYSCSTQKHSKHDACCFIR